METFLVPDYYKNFACKCGDCRETCCQGWGIALSMDDYFRVTGADCSPELRRRLDVAFRPADNPAPDRYAMISYNWLGRCHLQAEDGYCMLHRECGESSIPAICRQYPRMIRVAPVREACTSTSCEKTLELLLSSDAPVAFESLALTLADEPEPSPAANMDAARYQSMREQAVAILSDRARTFDERLAALADAFHAPLPKIDAPKLAAHLARTSSVMSQLLPQDDKRLALSSVPKMELYLEKIFVNHIFYKSFPHSFENSSPAAEIKSLAAVRALHQYAAESYLAHTGWSLEAFIDVTAKLFRMIEHSRFDEVAARA